VRINPDSNNDLECENYGNIKKCIVTNEHFINKTSGYYYTYHKNDFGEFSISPELSPIKIMTKAIIIKIINDKDQIKIGHKGVISFMTNFEDSKQLFEPTAIEAKIFNVEFSGYIKNYSADCHFWEQNSNYYVNLTKV
jgi:hypothetical protein